MLTTQLRHKEQTSSDLPDQDLFRDRRALKGHALKGRNNHHSSHDAETVRDGGYFVCPFNVEMTIEGFAVFPPGGALNQFAAQRIPGLTDAPVPSNRIGLG